MAKFHIVLFEPEIPANTGNIGRTCVATGASLHLIEPLGFSLSEKAIQRAGMDYWKDLDVRRYIKCRLAPVATQVRPIFPVFAGISGSNSTIWNFAICLPIPFL